jgi:hypothetical protein
MSLNKLLLSVFFIPILISCKGDISKMVSTDANMEKYIQNSEYTAIVYVDSTGGCTPCSFEYLNSWKAYQKALNRHNGNTACH